MNMLLHFRDAQTAGHNPQFASKGLPGKHQGCEHQVTSLSLMYVYISIHIHCLLSSWP